jgi:hypothetical protein
MGSDRSADDRAAAGVDRLSRRLDAWTARQSPLPRFREQVRALAENHWGEPVVVVYLGHRVRPGYAVPGRREDGTIEGERPARRFAWRILRGAVNAVVNVFTLLTAGGTHDVFQGEGGLTGPANSPALALVDAVRSATNAWLVFTAEGHVGVISSGWTNPDDSPPPDFRWQARHPDAPRVSPRRHRLTWPDGAVFAYHPAADS